MNHSVTSQTNGIKKLNIETTVLFAIDNIPSVDGDTLQKFLDLVNAMGNFGTISEEKLVAKMGLIMKYIPGACEDSLRTLAELLDIPFPGQVGNNRMPAAMIAQASEPQPTSPAWLN